MRISPSFRGFGSGVAPELSLVDPVFFTAVPAENGQE